MALRSGLAAQLGVATETTFGSRNAPDHFYELVNESMKLNRTRTAAKGIRPSKLVQRSQRFRTTRLDVTGDINLEVASNTYGLLLYHCLGAKAQAADGAGFKRTYTLGDTFGLSMTAQIGTPDVGGAVRVREYTGCKIDTWELAAAMDTVLSLKLSLDGINESTSQTLATPSWASNATNEVYYCDEVTLTVGGTPVKCHDFTLTGKNAMKTDRYYVGQQTKGEQLRNGYVDLTGQITPDFNDLTLYNMFVNDTVGTASALIITATGQKTYDTAKPNKIVITLPAVRYDGNTPNVSGPDVIDNPLPFTILDDDTNQPITIDYYTSDATD